MIHNLVRANDALIEKVLHLRMVLGLADQPALAKKVQPRVARMRPVRIVGLHDARYASRSRRFQHGELIRVRSQSRMRAKHGVLQEFERILKRWFRLLLETLDEKPYRDLRRDLAARVPPHAVGNDQQQGVATIGVGEPILIDLALALAAFLEDGEAHEREATSLR